MFNSKRFNCKKCKKFRIQNENERKKNLVINIDCGTYDITILKMNGNNFSKIFKLKIIFKKNNLYDKNFRFKKNLKIL